MNYISIVREFLKEKSPSKALLQNTKELLDHCSDVYYNSDIDSPLTDEEFDLVLQKYRKFDKYTAGAKPKQGKRVVDMGHDFPELVGTLDKVNFITQKQRLAAKQEDSDSVAEWFDRAMKAAGIKPTRKIRVAVTDKKDGNSIAVTGNDKQNITLALTRGKDGQGADMTSKFAGRKLNRIPVPKGDTVGVKYEAMVNDEDFEKVCGLMGRTFANSRSMTAGILGADKSESAQYVDYITLIPIRVQYKNTPITRDEELAIIRNIADHSSDQKINLNMEIIEGTVGEIIQQIGKIYDRYNKTDREKLDHPIDGLVIEILDEDIRQKLGRQEDRNNFEFALKFPYSVKRSNVQTIKFYVGDTGRVTPVVVFDTVKFNGANCNHVSIANYKRFRHLNLKKGDSVFIEYRNDVLSYLTKDPESKAEGKPIKFVANCPECGEKLKVNKTQTFVFCANTVGCPAIRRGKIVNWLKKLNIKGVKESTIRKLMDGGVLNDITDLYKLKVSDIAVLEGFQQRSAEIVIEAINSKTEMWDWELFGSLHFNGVGRGTCKLIFKEFTISDIFEMIKTGTYLERLTSIKGIEKITATNFVKGVVADQKIIKFAIKKLKIKSTKGDPSEKRGDPSKLYSFVFTGFRDAELQSALESVGHSIKSGVSKNIDILVAKDPKSNSGKAKEARELGKIVLGLDELKANLKEYM